MVKPELEESAATTVTRVRLRVDEDGIVFPDGVVWSDYMQRVKKLGIRIDHRLMEWCG